MRPTPSAPWLGSVLAVAISAAVVAGIAGSAGAQERGQPKPGDRTRVSSCVDYQQTQTDTGIDVRLESSCQMDLECSVSWRLVCEGDDAPRHRAKAFPLLAGTTAGLSASSADCGDASWAIERIRWSCKSSD